MQLCVVKVTDNVIAKKNYIFPFKTIDIFVRIVPVKLNYESIADRRVPKAQFFLKMTPNDISDAAPRPVL